MRGDYEVGDTVEIVQLMGHDQDRGYHAGQIVKIVVVNHLQGVVQCDSGGWFCIHQIRKVDAYLPLRITLAQLLTKAGKDEMRSAFKLIRQEERIAMMQVLHGIAYNEMRGR